MVQKVLLKTGADQTANDERTKHLDAAIEFLEKREIVYKMINTLKAYQQSIT